MKYLSQWGRVLKRNSKICDTNEEVTYIRKSNKTVKCIYEDRGLKRVHTDE